MRYSTRTLLILTAVVASLLATILMINSAIKTRVLASVDHPNGTRLRVVQYFNYQPELFTTSIYFDTGDGNWRWYYFDHQDAYWGNAEAQIMDNTVRITATNRQIDFDTVTGECTTVHSGRTRHHRKSDEITTLPSGADDSRNQRRDAG